MAADLYIIYDKDTNKLVTTFKFFGHKLYDYIKNDKRNLGWLNRTHPVDIIKYHQLK